MNSDIHNKNSTSVTVPLTAEQANDLIVQKAQQLVRRVIEQRGHDRPPFLPKEYSRLVNIKSTQQTDLQETSAMLLKMNDGYVIRINQNHSLVRQNFSFAHEIGHILFDDLKLEEYIRTIEYRGTLNTSKTANARSRTREMLCDTAAAELIMPEGAFRKYLCTFELSISSIEHMASAFSVSFQAASRRIAEVSMEPCIATMWQPWPKNKPTGLRSISSRQSRSGVKYFPVYEFVDFTSTLYKAYEHDSPIRSWKLFKSGYTKKRFPLEAKRFWSGETRYVISLAFPNREIGENHAGSNVVKQSQ